MAQYPEIKFARVNATADGVNAAIAAVAGKKIRVIGYALTNKTTAGTVALQDTAGSPVIHAELNFPLNGAVPYDGGLSAPAFETAVGTGVNVSNGVGVDTLGHITYIET